MNLDNYPTFREFMLGELKDYFEDICNNGVHNGYPYLTYYSDTVKLYDKYEKDIWDELEELREGMGNKSIMELIATFNCAPDIDSDTTFKNALVWFMAEETARKLTDIQSQESEDD